MRLDLGWTDVNCVTEQRATSESITNFTHFIVQLALTFDISGSLPLHLAIHLDVHGIQQSDEELDTCVYT